MKIKFQWNFPIPHEQLERQVAYGQSLNLPRILASAPHDRKLAVVGGGPSILDHVAELAAWDGEIWSLNGACRWLRERGIESTLFALDPCDFLAPQIVGAKKAIIATRCHKAVFDALAGADVQVFDVVNDAPEGFWGSTSAVLSVFHVAPHMGFRDITFYGCEGSYQTTSHIYMDDPACSDLAFIVECGGSSYITAPDMYAQSLELSKLIRFCHEKIREKSGGLLRAMVNERMKIDRDSLEIEPPHDITHVKTAVRDSLQPQKAA